MAQDISGFGLVITIRASVTYPIGLIVQDFADDSDPFDAPVMTVAEAAMGLNGDLVKWSKPEAIPVNISVIPGSPSDIGLRVLLDQNRVSKGKTSARDIITAIAVYPNGQIVRMSNGIIASGPIANSVASAGRLKSNTYGFLFEGKSGA